jgi:hypothetical protein
MAMVVAAKAGAPGCVERGSSGGSVTRPGGVCLGQWEAGNRQDERELSQQWLGWVAEAYRVGILVRRRSSHARRSEWRCVC